MKNVTQADTKVSSNKLDHLIYELNTIGSLPEREKFESYNKEFYKNLNEIKIIDLPIEKEKRLFYRFETNENACLTSTISQIAVTSEQLVQSNNDTYKEIKLLEEEIKVIKQEIQVVDSQFYETYSPQIVEMKKNIQNYLVEQKTENFKLIREIAVLEKEKIELQSKIYDQISKLIKIEKEVGVTSNTFNFQLDRLLDNKFMLDEH